MARTQKLLHLNKIDEFAEWAAVRGWVREPTMGKYEVLRMRKDGVHKLLVLFRSKYSNHATIPSDPRQGKPLVRKWLRERRRT